jgi:hypothetical protein
MGSSSPRPTHKNRSLNGIISYMSSTSSDLDDEHSNASSSSSIEDVTQLFNLNAPPPPIPTHEATFDVELPISIEHLEILMATKEPKQALLNAKASFAVTKNLINFKRNKLDVVGALKASFGSGLPKHPTKPRSKSMTVPKTAPSTTQISLNNLSTFMHVLEITYIPIIEVVQEPQPNNALDAETDNIHSEDIVYPTFIPSTIPVSHIF